MANTRQAYMLIVCVCVTKSTRERTAKAVPLAHHECMLNAWKNGKVERFRYVKIMSISPKLSILLYRVVVLHILCNSHLLGLFGNCFLLNIFGRNKTIGFWHYLTHPVCFPFSFYVQSLKRSFPFIMRSPCTHSALTAMLLPCVHLRSLLCSILAHCSSCVYIVFTYHSPWLHFSLAFALCLHSVFVHHFLFISVHQILFSNVLTVCSLCTHHSITVQVGK